MRDIAQQFQNWLKNRCQKWSTPILDAPDGRRDEFVDPYFKHAKNECGGGDSQSQVTGQDYDCHRGRRPLASGVQRIVQYNFYINDQRWGRMFVRICPYLPFSARVCLNQHHWLANRMRSEGFECFKQWID